MPDLISFDIVQDDGNAVLFLQLQQGVPQVDTFRLVQGTVGNAADGVHPLFVTLDIVARVEENPDDPGLKVALILQAFPFFPAAPDGFLYGILLIRLDHQLAPGDPVQRGCHPDDRPGEGFVGHFGFLLKIICPGILTSVRRRSRQTGFILAQVFAMKKCFKALSLSFVLPSSLHVYSKVYTGNPVSQRAIECKKYDKTDLGFSKDKKLIIIVMGSLGSTSVNEKLLDFLRTYEREDSEILFITGKTSYNDLSNNLIVPKSTKIVPFFDNLPSLMKSADLIISRAGASTIAEIMATKTPSILIPSPYVANNHQYYNALDLVNKKISYLIEEKDLNKDTLVEAIDYMFDPKTEKEVKENLKDVKDISSSTIILDEIKKIIKGKNEEESKEEI